MSTRSCFNQVPVGGACKTQLHSTDSMKAGFVFTKDTIQKSFEKTSEYLGTFERKIVFRTIFFFFSFLTILFQCLSFIPQAIWNTYSIKSDLGLLSLDFTLYKFVSCSSENCSNEPLDSISDNCDSDSRSVKGLIIFAFLIHFSFLSLTPFIYWMKKPYSLISTAAQYLLMSHVCFSLLFPAIAAGIWVESCMDDVERSLDFYVSTGIFSSFSSSYEWGWIINICGISACIVSFIGIGQILKDIRGSFNDRNKNHNLW